MRERLTDFSRGDALRLFWKLFFLRGRMSAGPVRSVLTFLLGRMAQHHGGYIGPGAVFGGVPSLPHGLHGVYISRYAAVGRDCRIYQNVTIGEIRGAAPRIGARCLIGAGAVVVGGITIGDDVKIGAGAVVRTDLPAGCTVTAPPPCIIRKEVL